MPEPPGNDHPAGSASPRESSGSGTSASAAATPDLAAAAVSGGLWMGVQVFVVKVTSMTGTWALVLLLSPEDFAIATLALSVQAMVVALQPTTMGDVLLARPDLLEQREATARRVSLVTTLVLALAIVAAGPLVAAHFGVPALALACAWVAGRTLSDWLMTMPLARLRSALRFRAIYGVDAVTSAVATATSILMAWRGAGYASILLPPIAMGFVRAWFYRRAAPSRATARWVGEQAGPLFRQLLHAGFGQYVHNALIAATPFVIGTFTGQREVGWYGIAFQISMQINTVVGFGIGLVLQPIFAHMAQDAARQSAALLRVCRVTAMVAMPVCLLQAALAPPLFRLLLPERWAGAIVMTQILSLGQAFFFCINPVMGLLRAQGRFRTLVIWQTVQLVVVMGAMIVAGLLLEAPLLPLVAIGGLYHAISGPIGVWISVRNRGASLADAMGVFLKPLLISTVAVLIPVVILSQVAPPGRTKDILDLVLVPLGSVAALWLLVPRFDRDTAQDLGRLFQAIRGAVTRRPAPVAGGAA